MKILGTGLSGLVGSRIVELLQSRHSFQNISLETGIDIRDFEAVLQLMQDSNADVVLHLAAKTDVDGCEKDKVLGKEGDAWKINVLGTKNIVSACQKTNTRLIYVSTDFVFDGENPPAGGYTEEDIPNPVNWYALTKFEGEKLVRTATLPWVIARIAYPYRATFPRKDFVRSIASLLKENKELEVVTDHIMSPTFIDDIARAFDILMQNNMQGVYHVVGSEHVTPFKAAGMIAETFGFSKEHIKQSTRMRYFANRAPRPFRLALKNDKIQRLGARMLGFSTGLQQIKDTISL